MNDLKKHLQEERFQRISRAWEYLTPVQRTSIFIRAVWWSLPTFFDMINHIENRVNVRITYFLYTAHWIGE